MDDAGRVRRVAGRLERGLDLARTIQERVGLIEDALRRERQIVLEEAKVDLAHLPKDVRDFVYSRLRALA